MLARLQVGRHQSVLEELPQGPQAQSVQIHVLTRGCNCSWGRFGSSRVSTPSGLDLRSFFLEHVMVLDKPSWQHGRAWRMTENAMTSMSAREIAWNEGLIEDGTATAVPRGSASVVCHSSIGSSCNSCYFGGWLFSNSSGCTSSFSCWTLVRIGGERSVGV